MPQRCQLLAHEHSPPSRMPEPTHVAVLLAGQLCQVHDESHITGWRRDDAPGDSSAGGLRYFS